MTTFHQVVITSRRWIAGTGLERGTSDRIDRAMRHGRGRRAWIVESPMDGDDGEIIEAAEAA